MEMLYVLHSLLILALLALPVVAPGLLLAGVLVMIMSTRRRRSARAWSSFVVLAALVGAAWAYASGWSQGGFGLLETDEACGVDESTVREVEESWWPPSFRCVLDDGTVRELVPASTTPLVVAALVVAGAAAVLAVGSRRRAGTGRRDADRGRDPAR